MNKVLTVLSKAPWKTITKVGGVVLLGTASVLGAMETDENTQKMIKKVASKVVKNETETS